VGGRAIDNTRGQPVSEDDIIKTKKKKNLQASEPTSGLKIICE